MFNNHSPSEKGSQSSSFYSAYKSNVEIVVNWSLIFSTLISSLDGLNSLDAYQNANFLALSEALLVFRLVWSLLHSWSDHTQAPTYAHLTTLPSSAGWMKEYRCRSSKSLEVSRTSSPNKWLADFITRGLLIAETWQSCIEGHDTMFKRPIWPSPRDRPTDSLWPWAHRGVPMPIGTVFRAHGATW